MNENKEKIDYTDKDCEKYHQEVDNTCQREERQKMSRWLDMAYEIVEKKAVALPRINQHILASVIATKLLEQYSKGVQDEIVRISGFSKKI